MEGSFGTGMLKGGGDCKEEPSCVGVHASSALTDLELKSKVVPRTFALYSFICKGFFIFMINVCKKVNQ